MKLSKDNFSKRSKWIKKPGKIDFDVTIYTYESMNNTYNVVTIAGVKLYQINMEGYSTDKVHHIHCEIEKHYNI